MTFQITRSALFTAPFKKTALLPAVGLTLMLSACITPQRTAGDDREDYRPWPGFERKQQQIVEVQQPALVVTNDPAPDVIYRRGSRDAIIEDRPAPINYTHRFTGAGVETLVTRKVSELSRDLHELQRSADSYDSRLVALQARADQEAGDYYGLVAGISARLQSGTTPGNPVLIEKWNAAQEKLNALSESSGSLNTLATDLANEASKASFLLESTRATFGLSGAVEEDHEKLTRLEDEVNQTIVRIGRLLNQVNDEINRRTAYLRTERLNMQTLSLAIANGELYGQSLTNSLFKRATEQGALPNRPEQGQPASRRPLVIIRFDRPNVNYEQALYTAVGQALEKYPAASFDLVAVSPLGSNPAETALASSQARKNGESVLRSLTQMGLPMERIRLNAAQSRDALNTEVHLYIQ